VRHPLAAPKPAQRPVAFISPKLCAVPAERAEICNAAEQPRRSLYRAYEGVRHPISISYARARIFHQSGAMLAPGFGRSDMTIFYSHHDRPRDPTGVSRAAITFPSRQMPAKRLRVFARWIAIRTTAAFKIIHQAIVAAKTRRLERELMFQVDPRDDGLVRTAQESRDSDKNIAKFPQRPMILGDKWDF
jgi:hypothetical protein